MQNTLLEKYLDSLGARLKGLSATQREGQIREVRGHLEALIEGHIGQGRSRDDATQLAIAQFGKAEKLGRELNGVAVGERVHSSIHWVAKGFFIWLCLWGLEFTFFSSMNNKPTDFPYQLGDRLLLSAVLATPALFGGHFYDKIVKKWQSRRTA
jgi:hypothetical protein